LLIFFFFLYFCAFKSYRLTGAIAGNGAHFIAFLVEGEKWYLYDGMATDIVVEQSDLPAGYLVTFGVFLKSI